MNKIEKMVDVAVCEMKAFTFGLAGGICYLGASLLQEWPTHHIGGAYLVVGVIFNFLMWRMIRQIRAG